MGTSLRMRRRWLDCGGSKERTNMALCKFGECLRNPDIAGDYCSAHAKAPVKGECSRCGAIVTCKACGELSEEKPTKVRATEHHSLVLQIREALGLGAGDDVLEAIRELRIAARRRQTTVASRPSCPLAAPTPDERSDTA
jgi:hypothetical protein